jgi:hypothetical protein
VNLPWQSTFGSGLLYETMRRAVLCLGIGFPENRMLILNLSHFPETQKLLFKVPGKGRSMG